MIFQEHSSILWIISLHANGGFRLRAEVICIPTCRCGDSTWKYWEDINRKEGNGLILWIGRVRVWNSEIALYRECLCFKLSGFTILPYFKYMAAYSHFLWYHKAWGVISLDRWPQWPPMPILGIPCPTVTIMSFRILITPATQRTHDPPWASLPTFPLHWWSVLLFSAKGRIILGVCKLTNTVIQIS